VREFQLLQSAGATFISVQLLNFKNYYTVCAASIYNVLLGKTLLYRFVNLLLLGLCWGKSSQGAFCRHASSENTTVGGSIST
jgi:hypothetical protein